MKQLKIMLAITIGKIASIMSKLIGKKGSTISGKIARKICPDILTFLRKQIRKEIIIVTGTNGKTTTNNILRDILKNSGAKVVCNSIGANMVNGITSAFVNYANLFGKVDADFACIEVDEGSMTKIVSELSPNKVVITNLFRDQLDRYGEIDITMDAINKALEKYDNTKLELILNSDDPLVAQFKFRHNFKTHFYGVSDNLSTKSCEESREGRFCTFCGSELAYNSYFYSQLGDYYCTNCDFKRPEIDFSASKIDISEGISFSLNFDNKSEEVFIDYKGFYNIYNCLAAISASLLCGAGIDDVRKSLSGYKPQIGRMERFELSKPLTLNLSKNPAGFNQAINTIITDERQKNILIIINDNAQDGKDISWLWDCDFENLKGRFNKYYVSGIRKEDMAIRLKYSDIDENVIIVDSDIKRAITAMLNNEIEAAYVLVNYTALFETQNILKDLEGVYGMEVKK